MSAGFRDGARSGAEPAPEEIPESTLQALRDGLGISRLQPPAIEEFLRGLPRRVTALVLPDDVDDEGDADDHDHHAGEAADSRGSDEGTSDDRSDRSSEAAGSDEHGSDEHGSDDRKADDARPAAEDLVPIADALDRLIERIMARGFGLMPDATVDAEPRDDLAPLDPETIAVVRRIESGAREAVRRLVGLPRTAWDDHPDLLDELRDGVVEVVARLRLLDRLQDEDEGGAEGGHGRDPDDDW